MDRNYIAPKNPIELVDFDARHFLMTCQKHGMAFADICNYLHKSQHSLQRALETGKINPRWLANLSKKFHIPSEDLRMPSLQALLPLRVYISMPRDRFAMADDMINTMYDHLIEVINVGYLKRLHEAYPDEQTIDVLRPDIRREDGWDIRRSISPMSEKLIRMADLVVFAPQWAVDINCQIEHQWAVYFAKEIIYINDEPDVYLERLGIHLGEADE